MHIDRPDRLAALVDMVLLITAPARLAPRVPVETFRALTQAGDRLRVETVGQQSSELIEIVPLQASILATLRSGHFSDRWTGETFAIDFVNVTSEACNVILDLYLPPLDGDYDDYKQLTVRAGPSRYEVTIHRGEPTPAIFQVETTLSAEFSIIAEPVMAVDGRSLGVLIASIRGSAGQVVDVFHLSTYVG